MVASAPCSGVTLSLTGKIGAQGRNRTTDTRIFKALTKIFKIYFGCVRGT
jgi:hypothetical protein